MDYGICPPPMKAQKALDILIKNILGEDWYVTIPMCQEQVNTVAVQEILYKFNSKKSFIERL